MSRSINLMPLLAQRRAARYAARRIWAPVVGFCWALIAAGLLAEAVINDGVGQRLAALEDAYTPIKLVKSQNALMLAQIEKTSATLRAAEEPLKRQSPVGVLGAVAKCVAKLGGDVYLTSIELAAASDAGAFRLDLRGIGGGALAVERLVALLNKFPGLGEVRLESVSTTETSAVGFLIVCNLP